MSGKIAIRIDEEKATDAPRTLSNRTRSSSNGRIVQVDTEKIRHNIASLSSEVAEFLSDVHQVGKFDLSQVELAVEIGATGGVNLIGTMTANAKGAVKLTFKPRVG